MKGHYQMNVYKKDLKGSYTPNNDFFPPVEDSSYCEDDVIREELDCTVDNVQKDISDSEAVYIVVLDYCKESYYAISETTAELKRGDLVLTKTRYGLDIVRLAGIVNSRPIPAKRKDLLYIKRLANEDEIKSLKENEAKAFKTNKIFKELVIKNKLDMRLVCSHFLLPEAKVMFFFTADYRIDFRHLVKDLVAYFKMRVELRQISARDESKICGGLGQCGRSFCCSCFCEKPPNVSSKMARDQSFSLISQKASGPCGRLMCCLSFEHAWYASEKHNFPPRGFRFSLAGENFIVSDINMLSDNVTINDSQSRSFVVPCKCFSYDNNTWLADPHYFENLE